MTGGSKARIIELLIVAAAVAGAFALLRPKFLMPGDAGRDYRARQGAKVILIAVREYAAKHNGHYPEDSAISGGGAGDALIGGRHLSHYPPNPFRTDGSPMRRTPFDAPSPGDFSYRRHPAKPYEFEFVVYGARGTVFVRRFGD